MMAKNSRRHPMSFFRWFTVAVAAVIAVAAGPTSQVAAQNINEAITVEDLGFTQWLGVGARPAGMAGAYVAASNDVHALYYNPAGLARVRRIDVSLGFQHTQSNVKNTFYGKLNETEFSTTTLDGISAAYPVPSYRGSLVLAGGVYRVMSSQFEILNRGVNTDTNTYDDYLLQQSGNVYSYNVGFGVDLSPAVSVGLNGFILDGTIKALTQFSYSFLGPLEDGDFESEALSDDAEVDINGYGLMVGLQYHPHSVLHFGLAIATPVKINLKGTAYEENAYYYVNSEDEYYAEQFYIDSDYKLPLRVAAGLSITPPHLVLSFDAEYVDWRQTESNGVQLKDENLNAVFREVLNLRLGGEILVPVIPVRLRAGYAIIPYALEYLQADRISGDSIQKADIETERQLATVGVGILIGRVLSLDASYERQIGKRSIESLIDERTGDRLILSGSYRF
jgi:hypothetical protein